MLAWYPVVYWHKARSNAIFDKSNNEFVIGIHMGTGEVQDGYLARILLLVVYDSFQAVADLLIAGRLELRSGNVVGRLDCRW